MADNYKRMVLNAPNDCRVSMNFEFCEALPIREFLERIDLQNLFQCVSYWQGLKFHFTFVGVTRNNSFYNREVYIPVNLLHLNPETIEVSLWHEIKSFCLYDFETEPKISKMRIATFIFK